MSPGHTCIHIYIYFFVVCSKFLTLSEMQVRLLLFREGYFPCSIMIHFFPVEMKLIITVHLALI